MVLLEHLPLFGLALSFAHYHNHGRSSHHHPSLPNHRPVAQISADISHFHQAPKLIAARASDETKETIVQIPQHQLQTILDRIKALEDDIFNLLSNADSSSELGATPARYFSKDYTDLTSTEPEKIVVTTREPKSTPASTSIIGGLFEESSVDIDASVASDIKSTTTVTWTTWITRTVTKVPQAIVTVTTFPSNLVEEDKFKAIVPFANGTTSAIPQRTTPSDDRIQPFNPSSTDVDAERGRPTITSMSYNASASIHRVSLSATASGFRTLRRAA